MRKDADDTQAPRILTAKAEMPGDIQVDDTFVYWMEEDGLIRRQRKDGTRPADGIVGVSPPPSTFIVSGGHVYWALETAAGSTIQRVAKDRLFARSENLLAAGPGLIGSMAADDDALYFTSKAQGCVYKLGK